MTKYTYPFRPYGDTRSELEEMVKHERTTVNQFLNDLVKEKYKTFIKLNKNTYGKHNNNSANQEG